MKSLWYVTRAVFAAFGGVLGWFLGDLNGTMYMLIAFVICDYITGFICAAYDKKLSSATGFIGIAKKVLICRIASVVSAETSLPCIRNIR